MRLASRPRSALTAVALLGLAAGLTTIGDAAANGRFPSSVAVEFRPGDPDDVYLGTTFGLLISQDDGASFRWLCEKSIGYEGAFDPHYRIGIDGTIYASTYNGLRVSHDGGCTFTTATEALAKDDPGRIARTWIDGLDLGPTGEVWVVTAEGGRANDAYRSIDGARTFMPTGLRSDTIWWKSVVVAPGDAQRVYVTGYQVSQNGPEGETPPTVHLRRTRNAGGAWDTLPISGLLLATSPLVLIEAVDPRAPDIVYARSVRAIAPEGDILYRSADAGDSWRPVLGTADGIRGLVIRGDEVLVATQRGGSHRSLDRGQTFTALAGAPQAACLGDRAGTLFACGANWQPDGFSLGRSLDAAAWTKVFRFSELKGPLSCPVGTVQHDLCAVEQWPMVRSQFGIPVEQTVDAGTEPATPEGGCCDASGAGAVPAAAAAMMVAMGVWRGRRRRRCCR